MTACLSISKVLAVLHDSVERDRTSQRKEAEKLQFEAWSDFRNYRILRMNLRSNGINEIESAKSIADLRTSSTITGAKLQTNCEGLDSKTQVVSRRSSTEMSKEESMLKKKLHKNRKRSLAGRQGASRIFLFFQVSDKDEPDLDLQRTVVQYAMG